MKRQANVLSALIQNFDTVESVIETSANSAGSALKENERYLDSIQGKIDQFNNAMQTMWSNTLDSDFVKGFVAIGTEIIKIIDKIGLLTSAFIAFATYSMIKNKMGPIAFLGEISKLITSGASKIKTYVASMTSMVVANKAVAQSTELTTVGSLKNAMAVAKVDVANKEAILSQLGLAGANKTQSITRDSLTASTISAMVAEGRLTQAQANTIMSLLGINAATNEVNAARMNEILIAAGLEKTQRAQIITQLGLSGSTKNLAKDSVLQAMATAGLSKEQQVAILSALGLTGANTGLAASFKALWTAMWPILAVAGAIAAIYGVVKLFDAMIVTTEELREELDGLKSELQDIQSELESVNSELKTTEDRMAELLAKDSLTFTEEEELSNLQKQNDELQRRIDLLELEEGIKQKEAAKKFNQTMDSNVNSTGEYISSDDTEKLFDNWYDYINPYRYGQLVSHWFGFGGEDGTESQQLDARIKEYEQLQKDLIEQENKIIASGGTDKTAKEKKAEIEKEIQDIGAFITKKTAEFNEDAEGLEYGINTETDEWLDYINNLQDRFAIASGGKNAETNAITRIFNKDEFSDAKAEIDSLVEQFKANPSDTTILEDIREQCELAEDDLESVGLSADKAFKYFTSFGSTKDTSTLEGKTEELASVSDRLSTLFAGGHKQKPVDFVGPLLPAQQDFASLFDENGDVLSDKIAEFFGGENGGISEQTQAEIERLAKQIYDGKITVDQALKSFSAFSMVESWKIVEAQVSELNTDVFKNLGDEISGVIDTVKELSAAFEDVSKSIDLVNQAEAEMAYSGHLSIETALQLMESTDNWNDVLEIEEGNLKLANGAEEALIQTKLDLIKTNIQTALSTVEAQLAQLDATDANIGAATTIEESTNVAVVELAANMAFAAKMAEAYTIAMNGGEVNMQEYMDEAEQAKQDVIDKTNYVKNSREKLDRTELEKQRDRLKAMLGIAENADTRSEFEDNSSSDEVSGGNDTKEDVIDDAFERAMDYWENRIGANRALYEQIQSDIDLLEKQGKIAGESYYLGQIEVENERLQHLKDQRDEATKYLNQLTPGDEKWWDVANTLNDIEGEIDDVTASIQDLNDAIDQVHWTIFDEAHERIDDLTTELSNVRDILSVDEDAFFTDEGEWTEDGVAVLATYIQDINLYKNALSDVEKELANIDIADFDSEQEYYDKLKELTDQQYTYTKAIIDSEQSVADMYESNIEAVEEYTQTLVDSYSDYIDNVKEALQAERDLYTFKKNVQKQTKDIASLERRISSLAGSTNASDVAERRKLEAQLYESRESLEDTYYENSRQAQDEALEAEALAYEETMNRFVENLRTNLDIALEDMDAFIAGVTSIVTLNAETVLNKYQSTELQLSPALTNPWEKAKAAANAYSGDALSLMNEWTKGGGFFDQFNTEGSKDLSSPWNVGKTAAQGFESSIKTTMSTVYTSVKTNVENSITKLNELKSKYDEINDSTVRPPATNDQNTDDDDSGNTKQKKYYTTATLKVGAKTLSVTESGDNADQSKSRALVGILGAYEKLKGNSLSAESAWQRTYRNQVKYETKYYAKGTTGVPDDQLAIVDELGPELMLRANPTTGRLDYVTAGTGIIPADLTKNLMEWGQFTPDSMNLGGGVNVNMINNAVTKPVFELNVDNFLRCDNVSQDSLPELKKFVRTEMDNLVRQMNYSVKKYSR